MYKLILFHSSSDLVPMVNTHYFTVGSKVKKKEFTSSLLPVQYLF